MFYNFSISDTKVTTPKCWSYFCKILFIKTDPFKIYCQRVNIFPIAEMNKKNYKYETI